MERHVIDVAAVLRVDQVSWTRRHCSSALMHAANPADIQGYRYGLKLNLDQLRSTQVLQRCSGFYFEFKGILPTTHNPPNRSDFFSESSAP